jgi:hypothetical protein
VGGNDRSSYLTALGRLDVESSVRHSIRSIVTLSYNAVVASSLRADAALTTVFHDAEEIVRKADERLSSAQVIETSNSGLTEYEPISWTLMAEWIPNLTRTSPQERAEKLLHASRAMGWELGENEFGKHVVCRFLPYLPALMVHKAADFILPVAEPALISIGLPLEGTARIVAELLATGAALGAGKVVEERTKEFMVGQFAKRKTKRVLGLLQKGFPSSEGLAR